MDFSRPGTYSSPLSSRCSAPGQTIGLNIRLISNFYYSINRVFDDVYKSKEGF